MKKKQRPYSFLFYGTVTYIITFVLTGIPNVLIGKASYQDLLYSNLITGPAETGLYNLPTSWWIYLSVKEFPFAFGHLSYFLSILCGLGLSVYLLVGSRWKKESQKALFFIIISGVLFGLSLIPLRMGAASNRVLVLLPFLSLILGAGSTYLFRAYKGILRFAISGVVILVIFTQITESTIWMYTKLRRDPQSESSEWIQKNIPVGSEIGIENIPIYQGLPNIIEKEFYLLQYPYHPGIRYRYSVIDSKSVTLPRIIVLTNDRIHINLFNHSDKKELLIRMTKNGYKKIADFSPDFTYYHLMGDDTQYFFSGISASPLNVSVYKKEIAEN